MGDGLVNLYSLPSFDEGANPERVLPAEIKSAKLRIAGSVILFSKLNPRIPRIWYVDKPGPGSYASTEFLPLVARSSDVDIRYIYYWLSSQTSEIAAAARGTTGSHQRIGPQDLLARPISLPSMAEQRAIAATLGALDDKIESNRRKSALAMDLAMAIASREVTGSDSDAYERAMTVHMGAAFKGEFFCEVGKGRPLLRIRDLKTFSPQTWTTENRHDETIIEPGSIVVGMDAEFKATLWCGPRALLNQRVCQFKPIPGVSRAYLLVSLAPRLSFYEQAKTGTTVIHLNKSDIETFEVPKLTADQHRFLYSATEPLIDLVVECGQEIERLEKLRDALLPELLAGRIRVGEVAT